MHMVWTRAVCSRMKTDFRYSATTVYNNFPLPALSGSSTERLTRAGLRVLDAREYHCEQTLADLYDPDAMPGDLKLAHSELDTLVDSVYSQSGYDSDEQRLSDLFAMYEAMIAQEPAKTPTKTAKRTRK